VQSRNLSPDVAYWMAQLAGAPTVLELPADRPRPSVRDYRGARLAIHLDDGLTGNLKELARRESCTLFMTLLAGFAALIHRYTEQADIIVGSPVANRNRSETEDTIGFFVNMLPLRVRPAGDRSFRELLRDVREVSLEASAHQDLPFEDLVRQLRPGRTQSHNPVFQVAFILQTAPVPTHGGGVAFEPVELDPGTAKFDVSLNLEEKAGGLDGWLEFATELFDADRIVRMASHLHRLLDSAASNPDAPIASLPLLAPEERRRLLIDWNATGSDYPRDRCIHEVFEEQADRTPEAPAVVSAGGRLSFRELDVRANRLARLLRRRGTVPEAKVGVCLERSAEAVVAFLAILKAGGVYVPLDPAYPRARLAGMLEDAKVETVLTTTQFDAALPTTVDRIRLDAKPESEESPERLGSGSRPEGLAYVMFTSGSTGKPKGVEVVHRGVVRLVRGTDYARFSPEETFLQYAPLSFDASTFEIWGSLLNGGRLVVPEPGPLSIDDLHRVIEDAAVTTLWLTAGLFHAIVDAKPEALRRVRQLLAGGDVLSPLRVHKLRRVCPETRVINGYGPTEGTTFSTSFSVAGEVDERLSIPIGRPIANTRVYVLDSHGQPVPVGIPGELYIGGDGLARGYCNAPELTREKFVTNALPETLDTRLYRTGDLVRYRSDGNLEFLGRADGQVKVRGFRIEPGEIEAVLGKHAKIRETVVVAREDVPGAKRLVAYLVADGNPPDAEELRAFLKETLPDYMVPSAFVVLESLPLTVNGKVDRRALPAPESVRSESDTASVAPRTSVEKTLARIWADVLRLPHVGVNDNFFELGGDSILSLQIVARAHQAGLGLAPRHLFQHQSISELAAVADLAPAISAEQGMVVGPAPLTPIQHWLLDGDLPEPHHWNMPMMLEVVPSTNPALLERAFASLLDHHDALRVRFLHDASGWRQVFGGTETTPIFSRLDLSAFSEGERSAAMAAAAADLETRLNLSEGPLVRALLVDSGAGMSGRLLVVIHHLAVDGVSWRILAEDLQQAYRQINVGEPVSLPPKTTSFQDWSRRLTGHAQSEPLRREASYWLRPFEDSPRPLPADFPEGRASNTEDSSRTVQVSLGEEETLALLQQVPGATQAQVNEVLLTALAQTLSAWTRREDLLIDVEGHGREDIVEGVDLSRTVGWFTSIFPVRLRIANGGDPLAALKAIQEQLRAVPNRGIGYGLLRYLSRESAVSAQLRAQPQAEVAFNYLGQFDPPASDRAPIRLTRETCGPYRSPRARRPHVFQIDAAVADGRLQVGWNYSDRIHRSDTVERLAQSLIQVLRTLITQGASRSAATTGCTPADFPLADLDQQKLDRILAAVRSRKGR
jgi:amino acid adenylation domain-containing protein/non-ribosomal peptide synthase protein (TIGR01720 family)